MNAYIFAASDLSDYSRRFIADHATWPNSDFHRALEAGTAAGTICVCYDGDGRIIGWARTERWENWPTLEAFVLPGSRGRCVATFCAAGLVARGEFVESGGYCAVFGRPMLAVAARVGLDPVLFSRSPAGWTVDWRRA